jgi:hypothetical protein
MRINGGSTGISTYWKLQNASTGAPQTGLAPSGTTLVYVRDLASPVSSVCTSLASASSAWSSYGMIELSSTVLPGYYRIDAPDAAFATGTNVHKVQLGVTNSSIDPAYQEVEFDMLNINMTQINGATVTSTLASTTDLVNASTSGTNASTVIQTIASETTSIYNKLPTAYIMGSSDKNNYNTAIVSGNNIANSILTIAHKLDTMWSLNGSVYEFTADALVNSPVGTGGFTSSDRTNLNAVETVTNIISTMYENISGYRWNSNSLSATPVPSGTATASALSTVSTNVDTILSQTTTTGVAIPNIETGLTFIHAMQAIFALTAKMNGGGTTTINARDYADSKNRVTWTTDAENNRLTVTFNFD